ncbi:glycoside hydrolase family 15 protein [Candidatus Daviesbacteria bacterium]|nr:glycoside hydrolase family 15 protein [Candidatus Daviesbacteria bacterium]
MNKPATNPAYLPLTDYGIIGDCRSCALISTEGSIDWCCLPDFDCPAYFLKLLDSKKGGFFKIAPVGFYQSNQKYKQNTNILKTFFFNPKGSVSLTDFMPLTQEHESLQQIPEFGPKIVRLVKALKGDHGFELKLKITPDFARRKVKITKINGSVVIEDSNFKFVLHKKHHLVKIEDDLVTVKFKLREGEQEFFSLDFYPSDYTYKRISKERINALLAKLYFQTTNFWRNWASICKYQGKYQQEVLRSALALKLLTFNPTGAIVASPTTSLPEKVGGQFNWDYRYTWLRDASFTVYAFLGLGYLKEAQQFIQWLESVCLREGSVLKIMYGIRGEEELTEIELSHLDGYMSSKPVRVGNGAENQKQFDIFGEVLTAINLYVESGGHVSDQIKIFIKKLVDYCCIHWREKDDGVWEGRSGQKHHTYSKLMCWAGVDRGINLAKTLNIKDVDLSFWQYSRNQIKQDILKKGYNRRVKSFVAYYRSDVIDTSTLNIALTGMLEASDQRIISTIDNIMRNLVVDWFVLRTADQKDWTKQGESPFFLSTFWLIDVLSLLGRVDEANVWMDKIIHDASPLGLYAEEFDPVKKIHLGNFPQAFTHLGLINSALNLKQAEVYGSEKKASIPTERLSKVVKSLFSPLLQNIQT